MLIKNYTLSFFFYFLKNNQEYLIHAPGILFSVCLSYINFHLVGFVIVKSCSK